MVKRGKREHEGSDPKAEREAEPMQFNDLIQNLNDLQDGEAVQTRPGAGRKSINQKYTRRTKHEDDLTPMAHTD